MSSGPLIHVRNLTKRFRDHLVLDHLDLEVYPGELIVILGRSGTGKSILLKHLVGIVQADAGTIEIGGITVSGMSIEDRVHLPTRMGFLFQESALFDSMTIEENVGFFLTQHTDLGSEEIRHKVKGALRLVGLEHIEHKRPAELSGGMKKRAALARLALQQPSILLYDEPTTGLDPINAMHINSLILKLQKQNNTTTVVVTHDPISALCLADRIALMDQGRIVSIGDPESILLLDHPMIHLLKQLVPQGIHQLKARLAEEAHL